MTVTAAAGEPVTVHGGAVTASVFVTTGLVLVTHFVESVIGTKEEQKEDALRAIRTALQSSTVPLFSSASSARGRTWASEELRRRKVESSVNFEAIVRMPIAFGRVAC